MADENENNTTTNALRKCVDASTNALIFPVATELGSFLADALYHLTGKVHLSAEKMRAKNAHNLQIFKEELLQELNSKPEECLTMPKQQVVSQAFEQSKNCLDEKELRNMFKKLIANASDSRYQSLVHPSFPSIISQLSPLDAENLELFRRGNDFNKRLPIANCQLRLKSGGNILLFANCFLENSKMSSRTDLELQATSIASLLRQGIIEVTYTRWFTDDTLYAKFFSSAPMIEAKNIMENPNLKSRPSTWKNAQKLDIEKGMVELTSLGKSFVKVCFDD